MFVGGITEVGYKPPQRPKRRVLPTKNKVYIPVPDDVPVVLERVWDNYKTIAEILIHDSKKLEIGMAARDGEKKLTLRFWYIRKDEIDFRPSSRGITLPLTQNVDGEVDYPMADLGKIIQKALDEEPDFEIWTQDNQVWKPRKKKKVKKQ